MNQRPLKPCVTPFALIFSLALTGCALGNAGSNTSPTLSSAAHHTGAIHGGQQPVSGFALQLYEIGNAGYFTAARPMLSQPVLTDANGMFDVTETYTCTTGNQIYLAGTGGNPGLPAGASNPALALMSAIGECSYLLANRDTIYLSVNELTTIAAAWSLSPFMSSPTNAGTSSNNARGLANAFANIANVVDSSTGTLPGKTLPANATLPIRQLDSLGDILATCVNSDGDLSPGSNCARLFAAATPPGGVAPADTITAALNIARNPTRNVAALYVLYPPASPFQPTDAQQPDNWMIGIKFSGGGLSQPAALALDAAGNVWTANPGNNSASKFSSSGTALSPTAGFTDPSLSMPAAIAIDSAGNAWLANAAGSSVTGLAPSGALTATLATNLSHPNGIAFDASGNSWVTSPGTGTLVEFGPNHAFQQQIPLGATPTAIAINPK